MSESALFLLAAAGLVLAALAVVIRPLLRASRASRRVDAQQANVAILREQLRDLEAEHAAGTIGAAEFAEARLELQGRVLAETDAAEAAAVTARPGGRRTALILCLAIPLAALGGYRLLGTPQALDPLARSARLDAHQIEGMLKTLQAKLAANPDDGPSWVLLARSLKTLGRFAEAGDAYARAGAVVERDASLLADHAEVLARAQGDDFAGKPAELLARALKLDPDEPQALFLAGAAASDRRDFAAVVEYWGRLLPQLEPGSDEAKSLAAAVDKARELARAGKPGDKAKARPEAVSGTVSLAGKLADQARADDLVFVFARAEDGSRMPLAVARLRVADLPYRFVLDDSLALPGGGKISDAPAFTLEARVAKAGQAQAGSGDLYGRLAKVKPGSKQLKLVIDQIQP